MISQGVFLSKVNQYIFIVDCSSKLKAYKGYNWRHPQKESAFMSPQHLKANKQAGGSVKWDDRYWKCIKTVSLKRTWIEPGSV